MRFDPGSLDAHGDLGAFRTLQKQAGWRTKSVEAQMRRFLGSGARRKLRYAHLLVAALELERLPQPLLGVTAVTGRQTEWRGG